MLTHAEQSSLVQKACTRHCTTGISDIHIHIFLAECILPGSLDCMACQCVPIGQSWSLLYNRANFYQFGGNILVIGQFIFVSIFQWSSFECYIYWKGRKQAKLPNRTRQTALHSCNSWFSPVKRISTSCYGVTLNNFVYIWLVLGVFLSFLL